MRTTKIVGIGWALIDTPRARMQLRLTRSSPPIAPAPTQYYLPPLYPHPSRMPFRDLVGSQTHVATSNFPPRPCNTPPAPHPPPTHQRYPIIMDRIYSIRLPTSHHSTAARAVKKLAGIGPFVTWLHIITLDTAQCPSRPFPPSPVGLRQRAIHVRLFLLFHRYAVELAS